MGTGWSIHPTHMDDSEVTISIARHALQRYKHRAGSRISSSNVARRIRKCILDAIELGTLINISGAGQLALVTADTGANVFAVLEVTGPPEKPFAVTVCTIITAQMAIDSFGYTIGLMHMLSRVGTLGALSKGTFSLPDGKCSIHSRYRVNCTGHNQICSNPR
jgi:hypothetical protein